ncbi:hypothetical protein [Ralstonia phage RP13]|nr:hypothetical protein [Ralstonia phage RP13]
MDNRAKNAKLEITGIIGSTNIAGLPGFKFSINEEIGLSMPIMQITFTINLLKYAVDDIKLDQEFTLNRDNQKTSWKIANFTMPDENTINIIAFLNSYGFIHENKQSSTSGTSLDAIQSITSLPVKINSPAKLGDKQIWIQDNISDQSYCYNTLLHSNPKDTFFLYTVSSDGTLYINDYASLIQTPTVTFGGKDSDISYHQILIETIPISFRLRVLNSQFISKQQVAQDSYAGKDTSDLSNIYAVGLDCGNTYEGYDLAYNTINSYYLTFLEKLYSFNSRGGKYVKPLDVIKMDTYVDNSNTAVKSSMIGKNYIVTKVFTSQDDDSVMNQRIWFARIPDANSST